MVTFGVQIEPQFGFTSDEILSIAREAENLGLTTVTISDHFMLHEYSVGLPSLECWTVISALAAELKSIRVGPLVSCNSYRHPSLLAKMAATVDVISGGRLEFDIGAGRKRSEFEGYGFSFPPIKVRAEMLAEAIEILRRMWTQDRTSSEARHYSIRDAICSPKPVQRPSPPIWVGGGGDLVLRVAARFADGVNIPFRSPEGQPAMLSLALNT